jgi:hypothetical protein
MAVAGVAVVVPAAPAHADATMSSYVTISGFKRISSTAFSVTYKVKKTYPITHRVRLRITNVHSTVKLISHEFTTSTSVGKHTVTYTGELPINDTLQLHLMYQEYVTGGVYRTTHTSDRYRLFGAAYRYRSFHRVTAAEAASRFVVFTVPGATVEAVPGLSTLKAVAGTVYEGFRAVTGINKPKGRPECWALYRGDYVKNVTRWGNKGKKLAFYEKLSRWPSKKAWKQHPKKPSCSSTIAWTI